MFSGKAVIFSAPSGSGKTTIVKHLLKTNPQLGFSISACTRDKRGREEQNGKDYYFLTPEEFKLKIDQDAFVENRKSTRLNSSYVRISYAVFCLKKKRKEK